MNTSETVNSRIVDPARLPFAYADALNAGDADAVLALFHQDATMRTFSGDILTDREALRAEAIQTIAARAHLTNNPRFTQIGADTALTIVDWNLEATSPDGTRISPTGTTTAVARRSPDGSWRFAILNCQGAVENGALSAIEPSATEKNAST
ncbi:YybH family protein [Nocardia sp. NBC_01327]|uniref:YybH family protein n=1 Tax=Nocardia sp. NBC_01327 TaxID=2903593 RepID=UPI002E10224C|nr:SgcJ/EcaC family oxidoreductase [Nocardia sp. NBC_01327]